MFVHECILEVKKLLHGTQPCLATSEVNQMEEKPGCVKGILDHLNEPLTKLTFLFLSYVLPLLKEFNRVLSNPNLVKTPIVFFTKFELLILETNHLFKKVLYKFVQLKYVKECIFLIQRSSMLMT